MRSLSQFANEQVVDLALIRQKAAPQGVRSGTAQGLNYLYGLLRQRKRARRIPVALSEPGQSVQRFPFLLRCTQRGGHFQSFLIIGPRIRHARHPVKCFGAIQPGLQRAQFIPGIGCQAQRPGKRRGSVGKCVEVKRLHYADVI